MALHIEVPTIIKIREGVRINLSMTFSHAVENDLPQQKLKAEIEAEQKAGTLKRPLTKEDYVEVGKADTVSFWFIGGTSLSYRVGHEIEQKDFDRISRQLEALEYKEKNDRKPSDDKASQTA